MIKDIYGNTRFYGVYRGQVVDNKDTDLNKNRLKLLVPQILGTTPTDWAWPVATPGVAQVPPAIGDGVWVMFEGGDPSYPIWTGSFSATVQQGTTSPTTTVISPAVQYGSFYDTTNQTGSTTVATPIKLNNSTATSGVTVSANSRISVQKSGVYNIQFSAQLLNSTTADYDATFWLRINGVNLDATAGVISVPSKHGTVSGAIISGWNYFQSVSAGDYLELVWITENVGVSLAAIAATTSPNVPLSPSIILTVNQIA